MAQFNNKQSVASSVKDPIINRIARSFGQIVYKYVDVPDDHHMIISEFGRFKIAYGAGTHQINRLTEQYYILKDVFIGDYKRGILYRDNQYIAPPLKPGKYFINPELNETLKIVDDILIGDYQKGILYRDGVYIAPPLESGQHFANPGLHEIITISPEVFIDEYQQGVLIRNGQFVKILASGVHFANPAKKEEIKIYNLILIPECSRGIKTQDGKYIEVLMPGKRFINTFMKEELLIIPEVIIEENHQGLFLVDGKCVKTLEPGRHFANPLLKEQILNVNMQILTKELVEQSIVTKDTTSFKVRGILVYQIVDAIKATCLVNNIDFAIREQIKSITQQVLSEHDLDHIMANKLVLSQTIRDRVKDNCEDWGVEVKAIDIKEVILPEDLQFEMTASAKAKRSAESMLIKADAEVKNAESMKKVSDMLDSKAATHMREMETLKEIFKNPNVKVLFVASNVNELMDGRALGKIMKDVITEQIPSS